MVEIRWVLEKQGRVIELLTSIAAFCRLAAQATESGPRPGDAVVTVGLSLLGVQPAGGDEGTTAAVEQVWARREWPAPHEGG